MIVMKTENIRTLFKDYKQYYPEAAKQNPHPLVEKIRSGYYAILESRSDKAVMAEVMGKPERRVEYGI